ncbi:DNA polymerase III subunit gamma/tau [Oceanisphaera sp. IT1-181]|uniref:DNA polymerase III subunit gamma/tau n=1 Tax=Oceanisphaera sp. IT1-181 TaxID=3081199 RepID=UPI0029C9F108|nr:DNA polymerase III subunit gamma/tau [Oceanisphaera sp. IT1-181]
MNYQVLARKWRPQRFTEVVGQQHVLTALVNALAQGRLHHAYLFSGTRGVGKTSIARLLAKALNCDKGITPEPCGECSSCVEIEQGRFVDLLEIDAASRTKVEDTRELLDNVQYQPARGRFKVYLIDEVHMLSRHSFNALLKTLEEPPPHVKFLLATTDPQKLPITILSRCLQFHLKSLEPEQIDGQLQHILRQEQLPFEIEATAALARAADGSVRDALSLTDQALAFGNGEIRLAQVESMLGNLNHNQLMSLVNALLSGDGAAMLAQVSNLASQGPDYDHIHKELVGFWHQLALAQIVPAQPLLPYANDLNRLAPLISPEHIQLYYQICLQGRKDLPFAADGRAALEMTLLRTLAFRPQAASAAHGSATPTAVATEHNAVKKPEPPRMSPPEIAPPELAPAIATVASNEPVVAVPPRAGNQAAEASDGSVVVEDSVTVEDSVAIEGSAVAEGTAVSDEADAQLAAQLYHEQDTILTQAAQFGYQAAASMQPTPSPIPSTSPQVVQAPPAVELSNQAPAAVNPSVSSLAETNPSQVEPETGDPAAANVAQIRRLLQTRNRLRSHDLDATDNTPVRGATPVSRQAQPSYVPPASKGDNASSPAATAPSPVTAVPERVQTHNQASNPAHSSTLGQGQAPSAQSPAASFGNDQHNHSHNQGAELPPLDSYADMGAQQDADDLPPWLDDASDNTASQATWQSSVTPASSRSSQPTSRPSAPPARAQTLPQAANPAPAFVASGGLSASGGLNASGELNAMAGLRSGASQTATDPEPLKPSSLLAHATDTWTALVAQLPLGGLLRQLAMHSSLVQQSPNQWQLWLNPDHKHLLNDKACVELAAVLSEQQQAAINLQVQVGEQTGSLTPFDIEQQLYQSAISQAKDEIEADDAVQFLISRFAAELDRDSIEPMAQ